MRNEGEMVIASTRQAGTGQGEALLAGPRVCGLSSARDRARLREREQAERARVERVLARGPRDLERRRRDREDAVAVAVAAARPDAIAAARGSRAAVCCRVCGGHEVVQDEVSDRGVFCLAQCLRCEHRWTERGAERFEPAFERTLHRARVSSLREQAGARRANGA